MSKILSKLTIVSLALIMMLSMTACKKDKELDIEVGTYICNDGAQIEILPDHKMIISNYDFDSLQSALCDWLIDMADLSEEDSSDFRNSMNFNEKLVEQELSFELHSDMYEETGSMSIWLFKLLENEELTIYFTFVYYPASGEIVLDSSLMTMGQVTVASEVFSLRK